MPRPSLQSFLESMHTIPMPLKSPRDENTFVTEVSDGPSVESEPPASYVGARYVTRRGLGFGGMGIVNLAEDTHLQREVAIKSLRMEHQVREDLRARFLREAFVQARLEHPAIVPMYDLDRDENGTDFFTMKRVVGNTLEEVIAQLRESPASLPPRYSRRRLLSAFATVCMAMHYAHTRGIIHRDLKPSNIMLGEFGEVYVMDWGLAKVIDDEPSPSSVSSVAPGMSPSGTRPVVRPAATSAAHTQIGQLLGTVGYMAPEQESGAIAQLGPHSDVYALGAILYELVTLEPLHTPPNSYDSAPPVSRRTPIPRQWNFQPDDDLAPLAALWSAAVEPDWRRRRITALDLAEGIETYLDGVRDIERQKAMAEVHAQRAVSVTMRAAIAENPNEERQEALREGAKALALDPKHNVAAETIAQILQTPPVEVPAEVRTELDSMEEGQLRRYLLATATAQLFLAALGVFGVVLFALSQDSASVSGLFVTSLAAMGSSAWLFYRAAGNPNPAGWPLALALTSTIVIPFLQLLASWATLPLAITELCVSAFIASNAAGTRLIGWRPLYLVGLVSVLPMHWMFICMGLRQAPLASTVDGIGLILRLGTGITNPAVYVAILCLGTAVVCTMVSFVGRQLALNQEEEKRRILTLTWQLRQLLPSPSVQLPRLSLRPDSYAPGERASEKQPRFRRQR